jgi:hypothetical protein
MKIIAIISVATLLVVNVINKIAGIKRGKNVWYL